MREGQVSPLVSSTRPTPERTGGNPWPIPALAEAAERRVLLSGTAMSSLASGDFDGDGVPETLVRVSAGRARLADLGYFGSAFRRGALLLIDSSGALFGDLLGIRARGNAAPLAAVADFNRDGRLDLVLAGRRLSGVRNGLTFLAGNGDGTFASGATIGAAPTNVTSLEAGDVNGDGFADLVGTASVRAGRAGNANGANGANRLVPVSFDGDATGEKVWGVQREGDTDFGAHRPHQAGASAEAGGGVVTSSTLLPSGTGSGVLFGDSQFGGFGDDVSVAPGFTPPASRVGVSAEVGGARVGASADGFFFGDGSFGETDQVFVLFGNGAGGFATTGGSTVD